MKKLVNLFKNFKISNKIIIILLLPTFLLIFLLYQSIGHLLSQYQLSKNLAHEASYIQSASNLLHRLQIERGTSAIYLKSENDSGAKLNAARQITDQMLQSYRKDSEIIINHNPIPQLSNNIKQTLQLLNQLSTVRSNISDRNISTLQAIQSFTQINHKILSSYFSIVESVASDPQAFRLTKSIYTFGQAKERAGIIRATVVPILAENQVTPALLQRLITLVATQKQFFNEFNAVAPDNAKEQLKQVLQSPAGKKVAHILATISQNDPDAIQGLNTPPSEWFSEITQLINQMRTIESGLAQATEIYAEQQKSQALLNTIIEAIVLLIDFFNHYPSTYFFYSLFKNSLSDVISEAQQIEQGNLEFEEKEDFNHDEIGDLQQQ
ncbi:nitrate- and nitrite sensing domain-containing protein, partial [Piscirickettsia litoralis]|uniref:nitrate- and nitrite sensing domain-containing protein n=1 Tax=Piscirickettsia litoralis TaxID=1891921 RepID=UPI001112E2DB